MKESKRNGGGLCTYLKLVVITKDGEGGGMARTIEPLERGACNISSVHNV